MKDSIKFLKALTALITAVSQLLMWSNYSQIKNGKNKIRNAANKKFWRIKSGQQPKNFGMLPWDLAG